MIYPLNAVSQSIDVQIVDDVGLPVTGLVAATFPAVFFSIAGANADVAIALSDLATITSPWSVGGVKERGGGVYRVDGPDPMFTVSARVKLRGESANKRLLCPVIDVGIFSDVVPGTYPSGSAGAALGSIGSGLITTVNPVAQGGVVTIVRGDDYDAADGRALDWTDASAAWPTLTGATIAFEIGDGLLIVAGSVVTPTGPSKKVRAEPTALETATLEATIYDYDVRATLSSGNIVTLVRGQVKVIDDEGA